MILSHILKLGDFLRAQIEKADKFYIATALMKEYGLNLLKRAPENCEIRLLLGIDLPTPVSIFEYLLAQDKIKFKVFQEAKRTYHPKVYLIQINNEWQAYVGSANFTQGGFESNVEMTIPVTEKEDIDELLLWFDSVYKKGNNINDAWLVKYQNYFSKANEQKNKGRKLLDQFKNEIEAEKDPLSKFDFNGQFFQYEHHNAFSGRKPRERYDEEIINERLGVKRRLLDLHDLVWPNIKSKKWNIDHHYDSSHIVSSHTHSEGTSDELSALWLSYNRPKKEFKKLDHDSTPLNQMRLQVLVRYLNVAIHLTVGKDGGGYYERMNIREKLRQHDEYFLPEFLRLLIQLPESYYIRIAGVKKNVHSFKDETELRAFLLTDNLGNHYFIIGRKYIPDAREISKVSIAATVMSDFDRLIPIYKLLTVPV